MGDDQPSEERQDPQMTPVADGAWHQVECCLVLYRAVVRVCATVNTVLDVHASHESRVF